MRRAGRTTTTKEVVMSGQLPGLAEATRCADAQAATGCGLPSCMISLVPSREWSRKGSTPEIKHGGLADEVTGHRPAALGQ